MNQFYKAIIITAISSLIFSCSPLNSINLNNTYKASEIALEFKINYKKAISTYEGKSLTLIGRIDQYYKNKEGEIVIILAEKGKTEGVKCNLINSSKQVKKPLKQGKNIIIKGKCVGFNEMVIFDKCYIIP
ncbi:MAG: hypothetical protein JXR51_16525 [Bacteroidales bacterium]|nr:hypothetical protein [Bacteroidales bacterium]MBN2758773.1 hypothetical protein [Bacteroidales bacterium]